VITTGGYAKLMWYALAQEHEYIADIIDRACDVALIGPDLGCDETALLEVFVTHTQEELQKGKKVWEGRTDKHLVDHLKSELGHSYRHLNRLLNLLYMGDRNESDKVDESLAAEQVDAIFEECQKGWFEDFEESLIIEVIGKNTTNQNALMAQLYEKKYEQSLSKALKGKCGDRLHYALAALLLTKPDFLAMRLHDAMKGWFNNNDLLVRLLGGLDGEKMMGVAQAYETKYTQPLWSALRENVDGDFLKAGLTWVRALEEPSRGAEKFTEADVDSHGGDASALANMLDYLLLENDSLLVFVAYLDVETIREAVKGWGTDDTVLIRSFATRSKRALARVNIGYREAYGTPLQQLIDDEITSSSKPWYAYLAKFLVVQEEQADSMILDLAMNGSTVDHAALVEFLCARHPKRVRAAKVKWEQSHDDSLVDKLADSLAGDMKRLALRMLKGKRDLEDKVDVDESLARKQAHQLHDGGEDYIDVLCDNTSAQNAMCAKYFEEAYDMSLRRAISQEYSGPVKNALQALLIGPADWYASQLKAALSGENTNDETVCRIVGAHDKEEIKKIAAAYDKKYGISLKAAITNECKGNYKRLAVAWVDLPDQLEQPEKLVELKKVQEEVEATDTAGDGGAGQTFDDEISDEDDEAPSSHKPDSAIYRAKLALWQQKYEKYKELGKKRKEEHYQGLIMKYPPLPKGHKILRGYAEALEEEYKNGTHQEEDWTMIWLDTVTDEEFEEANSTRDFFKAWLDITESMVAEKIVSIKELKGHWGLIEEPPPPSKPTYAEPAPLAAYGAAVAQPAPAMPVAQPAYGTNYPQAAPPMAYPGAPPVAYPGMAVAQPMMQPGTCCSSSTTTTTTTSSHTTTGYPGMAMAQPMMQPMMPMAQPMMPQMATAMYTPQINPYGTTTAGYPMY